MLTLATSMRFEVQSRWSPVLGIGIREVATSGCADGVLGATRAKMEELTEVVCGVQRTTADMQSEVFKFNGVKPTCPTIPGCTACCHEKVECSTVEAAVVAWYVLTQMRRAPANELAKRLRVWLSDYIDAACQYHSRKRENTPHVETGYDRSFRFNRPAWSGAWKDPDRDDGKRWVSPRAYVNSKLLCPFHNGDSCDVYDVRPANCRLYCTATPNPKPSCHELFRLHRSSEVTLVSVPEVSGIAALALCVDDRTVLFQQAVAYCLGVSEAEPFQCEQLDVYFDEILKRKQTRQMSLGGER